MLYELFSETYVNYIFIFRKLFKLQNKLGLGREELSSGVDYHNLADAHK